MGDKIWVSRWWLGWILKKNYSVYNMAEDTCIPICNAACIFHPKIVREMVQREDNFAGREIIALLTPKILSPNCNWEWLISHHIKWIAMSVYGWKWNARRGYWILFVEKVASSLERVRPPMLSSATDINLCSDVFSMRFIQRKKQSLL